MNLFQRIKYALLYRRKVKKSDERLRCQFLPMSLEISETPPSPLGAFIIRFVFIMLVTFLLWASLSKVDKVAVARGKVVPQGRLKIVQPVEEAVITGILVEEGERVKKGQVLVELDSTSKKLDLDSIQNDLDVAKAEKFLLEKYLKGEKIEDLSAYQDTLKISGEMKETLVNFINSIENTDKSRKSMLYMLSKSSKERLGLENQNLKKLQTTLKKLRNSKKIISDLQKQQNSLMKLNNKVEPVVDNNVVEKTETGKDLPKKETTDNTEKSETSENLAKAEEVKKNEKSKAENTSNTSGQATVVKNDVSQQVNFKTKIYEIELEIQKVKNEIEMQKLRIKDAKTKCDESDINLKVFDNEKGSKALNMLIEKQKEIDKLNLMFLKAKKSISYQNLLSPVNGVVQNMTQSTVGGVVSPAQGVLTIVPDDVPLVVECYVRNQDIGFVQLEQKARIKVDTFSFQKYGFLEGTIKKISPDAFEHEKLGAVYKVNVELDEDSLTVGGRKIKISSGMAVTVEVKTGKRRVIDFLLEPLVKYSNEAFTIR